ncbi:MAG: pilus assembly protein PilO [Oscillatoriophycideae cyanobacterium NC_groundwater_1537_Pr4_S-0.65um_50_18]|nr:pilus assembly protein PilO [Oscillatoriophycideae cyanobacterium NC_groundwater_1537_Pr4_S-0.65um_50_18]
MTASGDFVSNGDGNLEGTTYPKFFGITLTPTVLGVLIALLGAVGAFLLWSNFVQPTLDKNQQLKQEIAEKEQQLLAQEETQKRIDAARIKLQEAKQLQADVLGLFASDQSVSTLLLDVNERVNAVNAGIQDPEKRAVLSKFSVNSEESGVVTDSSLGAAVNNRLERASYQVELQGSFPQTASIIRNIERLQPLLIISDFKSDSPAHKLVLDNQGRLIPANQPDTRVTTSFRMDALVPVKDSATTATPSPAAP